MSFESGSLGDGFAAELVDKSLAIQLQFFGAGFPPNSFITGKFNFDSLITWTYIATGTYKATFDAAIIPSRSKVLLEVFNAYEGKIYLPVLTWTSATELTLYIFDSTGALVDASLSSSRKMHMVVKVFK